MILRVVEGELDSSPTAPTRNHFLNFLMQQAKKWTSDLAYIMGI